MAEANGYCLFARGDALALVKCSGEGFGEIGSTGLMTGRGLAYLVWRDGAPMLSCRGDEFPAEPPQLETIRRFSEELKAALK